MTRKQMSDQVQYWLGLQQIAAYDETQMIGDLLLQGTIDLLGRTRCVVRCVHLRTKADVATYTLDHQIISLVDVDDGGMRRARRDQSATFPTSFSMIRSDILRLNPAPSEDGELDVWAVKRPNKMVEDTDSPGFEQFGAIPEEFQDAIVTYALWKAADYTDDQRSGDGERYRVLYEGQEGRGGRLGQIRSAVNKRGTARASDRRVRLRGVHGRRIWVG